MGGQRAERFRAFWWGWGRGWHIQGLMRTQLFPSPAALFVWLLCSSHWDLTPQWGKRLPRFWMEGRRRLTQGLPRRAWSSECLLSTWDSCCEEGNVRVCKMNNSNCYCVPSYTWYNSEKL